MTFSRKYMNTLWSKSLKVTKSKILMPFKVDIHLDGKLVESLKEAEPDTSLKDEAPPTSGDDLPDTGDQGHTPSI